jgi:predicted dehydrogenase
MQVRLAIVGAGRRGSDLIQEFDRQEDCRIVQVCDHNFSRVLTVRERFPHLPATVAYDDVLRDDTVTAVVIATPTATHYELARAALEAGKDVAVAAPLALHGREADELATLAASQNKKLAVGHTALYHAAVSEIKQMLALGQIGNLCYMESSRLTGRRDGAGTDVLWRLAVHDVAVALYLAGDRAVAVSATGGAFSGGALIDVAFVTLRYANGSFSQHHVGWLSTYRARRFFVSGLEGSLLFNDNRQRDKLRLFRQEAGVAALNDEAFGDNQGEALSLSLETMLAPPAGGDDSAVARQCADFVAAWRDDRTPLGNVNLGCQVVHVLEAAGHSIAKGGIPIALPSSLISDTN